MANGTPIGPSELVWRIKRAADTDYMLVACQVDVSVPLTRDVNTEQTKCGVFKSTGPLDAKGTINGMAMFDIDEADDALSYNELRALIVADDVFSSKFSDTDGKVYIEGDTKISNLELTSDSTTNAKFACSIEFMDPSSLDFTPTT